MKSSRRSYILMSRISKAFATKLGRLAVVIIVLSLFGLLFIGGAWLYGIWKIWAGVYLCLLLCSLVNLAAFVMLLVFFALGRRQGVFRI